MICDTVKAAVTDGERLRFEPNQIDTAWLNIHAESGWRIAVAHENLCVRLQNELSTAALVRQAMAVKTPGAILRSMLQYGDVAFCPSSTGAVGFRMPRSVFDEARRPDGESVGNLAVRQILGASTRAMGLDTVDCVPVDWI